MTKHFLAALIIVGLAGCAQLPSQAHKDVTLESIQHLIDQRQPHLQEQFDKAMESCGGQLQGQLTAQNQQLEELSKQLQALNNANPSFTNALCPPTTPANQYEGKMVVGSVEWVYLVQPQHHYKARVDSGATTSSIHAKNITRFERNGKKWVSFELQDEDKSTTQKLESPLVRNVAIRQASAEEPEHRAVVKLTIVLGNMQHESEFTLTDRTQMDYSVLLGRTFLQDIALIDVGRSMIQPKFEPSSLIPKEEPLESKSAEAETVKKVVKETPKVDDVQEKSVGPEHSKDNNEPIKTTPLE